MRIGSPKNWRSRAPSELAITMSGNYTGKSGAGDAGSMTSAAAAPRLETASREHKRSATFCSYDVDEAIYDPSEGKEYRLD